MHRAVTLSLALVTLAAIPARADIGPKPRTYAPGLQVRPGTDMPGVEVEMSSEEVSVTLTAEKKREEKLVVEAVFHMKNLGEAVELEEGFPVGPIANMTDFSVELDGKAVQTELVDLTTGKVVDLAATRKAGRGEERHDYWYIWKAPYGARSTCVHRVNYTVRYTHHYYTMVDTGYVLHTGAPWKNAIGRAKVTLRVEGLPVDHVYHVSPRQGLAREGDAFAWTFEGLEPTDAHDIRVHYDCEQTWTDALAEARANVEKAKAWSSHARLVELLEHAPLHARREAMTADEHAEYVRALASLISEAREENGLLVLPSREDKEHRRPYVRGDGADALLRFLRNACDALEARRDDAAARKVLELFMTLAERFQKGQLVTERGPLKLSERADRPGAEKRIEDNLARARRLLGPS